MAKKSIRLKPGDVIEIPLGDGWFAYARKYEDASYCPYELASKSRPSFERIISSELGEILTVGEYQSETGAWPIIGKHPFVREEDAWPPPVINGGWFCQHGQERRATQEEIEQYPEVVQYDEDSFVNYLRAKLLRLDPIPEPPREVPIDPLVAAMSIDRNDMAERVSIHFDELVGDGVSAKEAIRRTSAAFKEDLDDTDCEPHIWLALARLGLQHECLSKRVKQRALDVIESGRCWDVIDQVEPESYRGEATTLRQQVIEPFLARLKRTET